MGSGDKGAVIQIGRNQLGRRRLANDAAQFYGLCVQHFALSLDTADDREIVNFSGDRRQRLSVLSLGCLMVETLRNRGLKGGRWGTGGGGGRRVPRGHCVVAPAHPRSRPRGGRGRPHARRSHALSARVQRPADRRGSIPAGSAKISRPAEVWITEVTTAVMV